MENAMMPNTAQAKMEQAIATLARELPELSVREACTRIGWLRRQAVLEGFTPTAVLADGLADALTREGRAAPVQSWLDALAIAAGCGTGTPDTAPALLASIGVRFAA
jgi:hypothetical protein